MPKNKFEKKYFEVNAYRGDYWKRNPPEKYIPLLEKILLWKKQGTLLDIGCAYGIFLNLASKYFQCWGLDISSYALSIAKKKLPKTVNLILGNADNLKLERQFDVITCFDVLEHLKDPKKTIITINKHLRKDGVFAVLVPVYDNLGGKIAQLLDKDSTHLSKKDRKFWFSLIRNNNLEILYQTGCLRYLLFNRFYFHFSSKWITKISPAIFIIAKKTE